MAGSSRRYAPKARFVQRNPILFSGWSPGIRREWLLLLWVYTSVHYT